MADSKLPGRLLSQRARSPFQQLYRSAFASEDSMEGDVTPFKYVRLTGTVACALALYS